MESLPVNTLSTQSTAPVPGPEICTGPGEKVMDEETLEKIRTLAEAVEHWDLYERIRRALEQHFPELHDRLTLLYDTQTGEVFLADGVTRRIVVFVERASPGDTRIHSKSYEDVFEFLEYENRDSIKAQVLEGAVNQGILDGEVIYRDNSMHIYVYKENKLRYYIYNEDTDRFRECSEDEFRRFLGCTEV